MIFTPSDVRRLLQSPVVPVLCPPASRAVVVVVVVVLVLVLVVSHNRPSVRPSVRMRALTEWERSRVKGVWKNVSAAVTEETVHGLYPRSGLKSRGEGEKAFRR